MEIFKAPDKAVNGDFIEFEKDGESVFGFVRGDHNSGGLQVEVGIGLENGSLKAGEYVRLERDKIKRVIKDTP